VSIWKKLRQDFAHAFAVAPADAEFSSEEKALLERIAQLFVRRGMAAPALLFLESLGPLNFLGGQIVHGLKPFLDMACDPAEIGRLAVILERRASVDRLITLIQERITSSA
jgi:hypothetical protein